MRTWLRWARSRLGRPPESADPLAGLRGLAWWEERARIHGSRAVFHLGHPPDALDAVTRRQVDVLGPLFRQHLRGGEELVLDFGCGPGRFSGAVADWTGAEVVGVDPIQRLLDLAPPHPRVRYARMDRGRVPLGDHSASAVWVVLVLGGLVEEGALAQATAELDRVLRPGGLLFLAENVADKPSGANWAFRGVAGWQAALPFAGLRHVGGYTDLGEPIAVLAGYKQQ